MPLFALAAAKRPPSSSSAFNPVVITGRGTTTLQGRKSPITSTRTVFLFTLVGCGLMIAPGILWNFEYDQGTFAYGGHALLFGSRAYLDFWDIKPPNIFYTYAAAFGFFGESVRAIRVADFLNTLLTIALLFLLSERLWQGAAWRRAASVITCVVFSVQYNILGPHDTAQVENFAMPWVLLSILLALDRAQLPALDREQDVNRMLQLGIAGFLLAIAVFFKYPLGLFLLLPIAVVVSRRERDSPIPHVTSLLVGFVVGAALQILQLSALGELRELYRITTSSTIRYVSTNYSGSLTPLSNLRTLAQNLDILWLFAATIGWGAWIFTRGQEQRRRVGRTAGFLIGALLISLLIVQLQNKGYRYHYVVAFPWVDLMIGAGIAQAAALLSRVNRLPSLANAVILGLILTFGSGQWISHDTFGEKFGYTKKLLAGDTAANGYIEGDQLSDRVAVLSAPTDSIFIFGFQPYVYWRADRPPATPYLNTIHFKPKYADRLDRSRLVQALVSKPPRLFLVDTRDSYTSQGSTNAVSRAVIARQYPELEQLLRTAYKSVDTVRGMIIYQRREYPSYSNLPN